MEIKVNNLVKKFNDLNAVNDVSFDIKSNEIFALLGVNGAGKTTTIKILTGLLTKTSGDITFNNLPIEDITEEIKSKINVSPQETAIAENLTVYENIIFIAEIFGLSKEKAKTNANEIISKLNLTEVKNKKAKLLSGGMQRRLSIAMSLVTSPEILFLDEPTLGLDVLSRSDLWSLIASLKGQMSIILTTHYIEEAEQLADRVAIINNGKIIEIDTPKNIIKKTETSSLEQAFIKIVKGAK